MGLAGELLNCACDVALAAILYLLLKPANRNLALLAAFFRLAFVAVDVPAKFFLFASLLMLGDADYLQAFDPPQLHALAYLSIRLHGYGYGISFLFFGIHCALLGYVVYVSGYLPRIIGALLVIGGFGYVAHSLVQVLYLPFAASLFPWYCCPQFPRNSDSVCGSSSRASMSRSGGQPVSSTPQRHERRGVNSPPNHHRSSAHVPRAVTDRVVVARRSAGAPRRRCGHPIAVHFLRAVERRRRRPARRDHCAAAHGPGPARQAHEVRADIHRLGGV